MLGNRDEREKQRNQIVFKLLKSMDPFLPSLNQHEDIRNQILKILKQNAYNIIPEQNSSDEQQIQSLHLSRNHIVENKKIARSLASKVFDITIANGGCLNQQIQTKKKQLQIALSKQLQAQRQSKIVRKQIETIQNDVHKKFNINKKISDSSGNMNNYYQSSQSHHYPISNYSSLKYNNQTPIKNFNRTTRHNPYANNGLMNMIPSSRSIYTEDQNYRILSGNQGNQKGYQNGWQSERFHHYSNDFQNEYSDLNGKNYMTASYNNSNLHASNNKLTQITNKFTLLRSQLSHFQSPIKRYRHETDKLLSKNYQNMEENINKEKSIVNSQLALGLQSKISNKTNIFKSKSELTLKKNDIKQERAPKLQIFSSKHRSLSKKSTKIDKFLDQNPKIKLDISKLNRKVSQKTLKQSQKLDMQIMSSLLHRKMRDNDKSNTIASLIK